MEKVITGDPPPSFIPKGNQKPVPGLFRAPGETIYMLPVSLRAYNPPQHLSDAPLAPSILLHRSFYTLGVLSWSQSLPPDTVFS
nr:hypothetical protein [Nodosilinea sp. WJT8-NPBG4]